MMYLVDTNLILEVLLRQAKSEEVKRFLEHARSKQLFLTEFSLYSLGVLLIRRNMHDIFLRAVEDLPFTGRHDAVTTGSGRSGRCCVLIEAVRARFR